MILHECIILIRNTCRARTCINAPLHTAQLVTKTFTLKDATTQIICVNTNSTFIYNYFSMNTIGLLII